MADLDFASILAAGQQLVPDIEAQTNRQLQNRLAQAQLAAVQQDAAQQASFIQEAKGVWAAPTANGVASLMARYPKQAEAMKKAWDTMEERTRSRQLTDMGSILYAARRNDWPRAAELAEKWRKSEIDAGMLDDNDEEIYRIIREGTPEERAQVGGLIAFNLATAVGKDKFGQFFPDFQREMRLQDLHPAEMAKADSEAAIKGAEAENAPAYYSWRAADQKADAQKSQTEADFADDKARAELNWLEQRMANLRSLISKRNAAPATKQTGKPGSGKSSGGQAPIVATDGKGNRVRLNPRTNSWEPF